MRASGGWTKTLLAALAVLAAGAAGAWLWARRPAAPAPPPVARAADSAGLLAPRPVSLAPNLYLLGNTAPAAAYAVDTSDGLVLIDSGLEDDARPVMDQLADLHLDLGRLRAILLTHVHADHSLGARSLRSRTGARVYAGAADCGPLREGGPREAFFSTFHMPDRSPHPTPVDVELHGDEALTFGDTRFGVIAAPGHTPGSVCYLLERPGLRALFTGDVVQHLDPSTPDALGTYAAYLPPLYRGNARDYLATLRRLRALPAPDLVLPGHPALDPTPESPRLGARRWQGLLDQGIAEMEKLLARYDADGADFLDGIPKELLPGLHYLGSFGGSAAYALATPRDRFVIDAPGGPLFDAFLANRFKKLGWQDRKLTAVLLTSADERATAGLADLVRQTGCAVVAPRAGLEAVRALCPAGTALLTEDDLGKRGWLDVQVIPLPAGGRAPVAYRVRWAGKTVLASGRVPVKVTEVTGTELLREVPGPGGSVADYGAALDRLAEARPDLWLPAVPVHGQNANLYDDDWARVLSQDRRLLGLPTPAATGGRP